MTISISETRHTRRLGSNVRLVKCDTLEEKGSILSSNVTSQSINDNAFYCWGNWDVFKENLSKFYEVKGE